MEVSLELERKEKRLSPPAYLRQAFQGEGKGFTSTEATSFSGKGAKGGRIWVTFSRGGQGGPAGNSTCVQFSVKQWR